MPHARKSVAASPRAVVKHVVSGGQTGADRAALDWAIAHGIPHGGWCPRGRRAEDGRIAERYLLEETPSHEYAQRTRWNVRDSDGTLIVSRAPVLSGGSEYTARCAERLGRPWLHACPGADSAAAMLAFIKRHRIGTLNVAGPRLSNDPGIYQYTLVVLGRLVYGPSADRASASSSASSGQ